jgi:hypothetical protein
MREASHGSCETTRLHLVAEQEVRWEGGGPQLAGEYAFLSKGERE